MGAMHPHQNSLLDDKSNLLPRGRSRVPLPDHVSLSQLDRPPTPSGASGASGADGEVRGQRGGCFRKIPWRAPSPGSLAEDQRGSFIIPRESSVLYAMYLLNNTVTSPIHFNFLPLFLFV